MSDWQPIETAPRDDEKEIIIGRYAADGRPGWAHEGYWSAHDEAWMFANIDCTEHHPYAVHPTHWQPLPEPPEVSDE